MKRALALIIAAISSGTALAAGPSDSADRYDYNMRATNRDGYVPDAARSMDKFDPYTEGADKSTRANLAPTKVRSRHPKSTKPHRTAVTAER
ncbi:hypothetical protein AB4Z48_27570 [Cupriavidus sp. 2TAF22]|uniref:hypothetical protein n=1 Tax=unclassified Cupriavidus TaxID=2640874 RepID=UPI003F900BDD